MSHQQQERTATVIALKTAFLRTQTRILSQPLRAPESLDTADAEALPTRVVDDVLREVNRLARRHNKAVYSTLATRHVAEQIDKLYYNAGAPALTHHDPNPSPLDQDQDQDLTSSATIAALPQTLPLNTSTAATEADAASYAQALATLTSLAQQRRDLHARLQRLRKLRQTLEPLRHPAERLQPGLATRDGALGAELGRAKTLGVRVGARVWGWTKRGREGEECEEGESESDREGEGDKLRGVLAW